jgi:hypothetical protein
MMALPERDTHRGDVMTIVQSQILNPSTECWEVDSTEAISSAEAAYFLSSAGSEELALDSNALPGVSVRYCLVGPSGVLEGEAWTVAG